MTTRRLNAEVTYKAGRSSEGTAGKQNDIIEQAIVSKVDAHRRLARTTATPLCPTLNKAVDAGIKMFTWDADSPSSKRQFYCRGSG